MTVCLGVQGCLIVLGEKLQGIICVATAADHSAEISDVLLFQILDDRPLGADDLSLDRGASCHVHE